MIGMSKKMEQDEQKMEYINDVVPTSSVTGHATEISDMRGVFSESDYDDYGVDALAIYEIRA